MKNMLLLFLIFTTPCFAQNEGVSHWPTTKEEVLSSGVILPSPLRQQQERNLALLCRVWGFVKYFHPAVANGNVNIDKALFLIIPDVLKARNDKRLNKLLYNWIREFDEVPVISPQPLLPNVFREASLGWLHADSVVTGDLRKQLNKIFANRHRGNGYYVSKLKEIGNPDFSKEFPYKNVKGEDAGMRMLALFRYWNTVEYFYPSKYLTADNWDSVLQKFIPLFASAQTDQGYRVACLQLASTIHDTHSANISSDPVIQKYLGLYMIPAYFESVEGGMILSYFYTDSLRLLSNMIPGDEVLAVNGRNVTEMADSIRHYVTASNISSATNIVLNRMRRSNKPENKVTVLRNGKVLDLTVKYSLMDSISKYFKSSSFPYPMYQKMGDDIGYISLSKIKADSLPVIFKQFENTKGLVIDIRIYPSEFMPYAMGAYLKPELSSFVRFTAADLDLPGRFLIGDSVFNGRENPDYYKGKVVILVNVNSQSQSEFTAMALRTAPGAVVMGSQTSGADGNVSNIFLPGGMSSYISGLGVYYPDGKVTQGIGIVPDIEVKRTVKGISENRDELMEAALKYIRDMTGKKKN